MNKNEDNNEDNLKDSHKENRRDNSDNGHENYVQKCKKTNVLGFYHGQFF